MVRRRQGVLIAVDGPPQARRAQAVLLRAFLEGIGLRVHMSQPWEPWTEAWDDTSGATAGSTLRMAARLLRREQEIEPHLDSGEIVLAERSWSPPTQLRTRDVRSRLLARASAPRQEPDLRLGFGGILGPGGPCGDGAGGPTFVAEQMAARRAVLRLLRGLRGCSSEWGDSEGP